MKKINMSLIAALTLSGFAYAGGVFTEPIYETEDVVIAEEVVIPEEIYVAPPPVEEEYIAPPPVEEEYVAPPEEEVYVAPIEEEYVAPPEEIYVAPPKEVYVAPPPPPPPPPPVQQIRANGLYAGLGISAARFKPSCDCPSTGATDKTAGVVGRIGYDFNKYIGVEARGIRTNWKSDGGKIEHVGLFLKPMLPIGQQANLYGLAGYAKTKTQGKLQHVNAKTFAWGAGVEYDVSADHAKAGRYNRQFDGAGDQEKGLGIFADYERLIQKSKSPDLDTINVGVTYDF